METSLLSPPLITRQAVRAQRAAEMTLGDDAEHCLSTARPLNPLIYFVWRATPAIATILRPRLRSCSS